MNLKPLSGTLDLTDTDQWNGVSMTEGFLTLPGLSAFGSCPMCRASC